MRTYNDVFTWECDCGLTVHAGLDGDNDYDRLEVLHCPVCGTTQSTTQLIAHRDLSKEEVLSPKEQWRSIAKSLDMANKYGMGTERLKKYINDAPLSSADMTELELRIAAYNMAIHPPVVLTNKGD